MKNFINVGFEPKEIEELNRKKGGLSWHDFILKLAEKTEGFALTPAEKPKGSKGAKK